MGGIGVGLVISLQLIYPYSTALPFARAFGDSVGGETTNQLSASFQKQFEVSSVEFHAGTHISTRKLSVLGATLNSERMATRITTYEWWQRLLPLSLLWLQPSIDGLDVTMTGAQTVSQAASLAQELTYKPTDASVSISGDSLNIVNSIAGYSVTAEDVKHAIATATYRGGVTQVNVAGNVMSPARIDSDTAEARSMAASALSHTLSITVEGRGTYSPDKTTRAGWLTITTGGKEVKVTANRDAITRYVTALNVSVKTDPTPITVTVVDGVEKSRTAGSNGSALDVDALTEWLSSALLSTTNESHTSVQLKPVSPSVEYVRTYSHTQAGLQAYVAYATTTQNVRIVVQQLDGSGWSASGRANESIPSASTYKLFVMLRVFDDINSGALTWDTPMLDTTAGGCFERTIVPSTNPCAEEWIRQYGRSTLTNYLHAKGFSSGTGFTFNDAAHTTAGDLATYLVGLYNGTLVSGSNRDILLEKMGRQLYRYGIPSGTKGWTQDKVGFLWDYIHDAAIVHNPKGTYVLVIMTKGYSYGYIANVARQIDTILYD